MKTGPWERDSLCRSVEICSYGLVWTRFSNKDTCPDVQPASRGHGTTVCLSWNGTLYFPGQEEPVGQLRQQDEHLHGGTLLLSV